MGTPSMRSSARPAGIGVDQDADRVGLGVSARAPRCAADAAFEGEGAHARARADVAARKLPGRGGVERGDDVVRRDVPALDVVDALIVAFGHDRQRDVVLDADTGPARDQPVDHAVVDARDVQCVGQRDRHFEKAGLVDPVRAAQLTVAVEVPGRGGHALRPDVLVGQHEGSAGAHRTHAGDERAGRALDLGDLADLDARNVGDAVERPRGQRPDDDAGLGRAHARGTPRRRSERCRRGQGECATLHARTARLRAACHAVACHAVEGAFGRLKTVTQARCLSRYAEHILTRFAEHIHHTPLGDAGRRLVPPE
jgi:hypothetical protein